MKDNVYRAAPFVDSQGVVHSISFIPVKELKKYWRGDLESYAKDVALEGILLAKNSNDLLKARKIYDRLAPNVRDIITNIVGVTLEYANHDIKIKGIVDKNMQAMNVDESAEDFKQEAVDKGDTVKERVENVAIMELAKNCIMEEMKCDYGKAEELLKANPMWARVIINIVRTGKSIFPLKI